MSAVIASANAVYAVGADVFSVASLRYPVERTIIELIVIFKPSNCVKIVVND